MEKKCGIILKTAFPKKMKMIVLDHEIGKIEGVPPSDKWITGSLISYDAQKRGVLYFLHDIALLDMPLKLGKEDILFLHHVLEICSFCAPFSSEAGQIFELIVSLYGISESHLSFEFKIAFLFKLLMMLGMHPDDSRFQDPYYYILSRESIDTIMNKSIHLNTKQALHEWVRSCMSAHPLIHVFKTMHFLDTNRVP